MNVYLYQNSTEKILKNAYIGEYGWKPWENTVAYYPFRSDILDHSWNNNNFTWWAYTFSNNRITVTSKLSWPLIVPTSWTDARTIIAWITAYSQWNWNSRYDYATWSSWPNWLLKNNSDGAWVQLKIWSTWYDVKQTTLSEFSLIVLVKNWNKLSWYVNWNLVNTVTMSTDQWSFQFPTTYSELQPWTYWEIIVEDKIWTDSEISEYYNSTKSNYWL
jgi:hypothetical protein